MRRIQWVMFVLSALVAATVILEAQFWVSTGSSLTTAGPVTITNGSTGALAVTGGADIGGVIQAGSGNVNLTNSTGNLLEAAIADGTVYPRIAANETISGAWTFSAGPLTLVGGVSSDAIDVLGRNADSLGTIRFRRAAVSGTNVRGYLRSTSDTEMAIGAGLDTPTEIMRFGTTGVSNTTRYNSATAQPGVLAYLNANTNLTTVGLNTVPINTEVYDTGAVFGSNTFTAPVAGVYNVCASIEASTNSGLATFQVTTSVGLDMVLGTLGTATTPSVTLHKCAPLSLAASETVSIQTTVGGGQTITVFGAAGLRSFFSARLMP